MRDFASRLEGHKITQIERRGKFLWFPFNDFALIVHLGMSGQCLVLKSSQEVTHLRIRFEFKNTSSVMGFVDQRTFGGMQLDDLTIDKHQKSVPASVSHIALDPFDHDFDIKVAIEKLRRKNSEVKRALLDQTLVSGIGNIYADEALWLAKIHPRKAANRLSITQAEELLVSAKAVMQAAIEQGGTSFDQQYVQVNGQSGYFATELNVYGRAGEPCPRCARPVRREKFMNRSSHLCPNCQRAPKR